MKNRIVVEAFINGVEAVTTNLWSIKQDTQKAKKKNIFVLFSYGTHFPIAIKLRDGYLINKEKYSKTTSRHQSLLYSFLNEKEDKIISTNLEGIKRIWHKVNEEGLSTIDEVIIDKL